MCKWISPQIIGLALYMLECLFIINKNEIAYMNYLFGPHRVFVKYNRYHIWYLFTSVKDTINQNKLIRPQGTQYKLLSKNLNNYIIFISYFTQKNKYYALIFELLWFVKYSITLLSILSRMSDLHIYFILSLKILFLLIVLIWVIIP